MRATPGVLARSRWRALGTTAEIVVTDSDRLMTAEQTVQAELSAIDDACSRFRDDSEIPRLHRANGGTVVVGQLLAEALQVALRAAELTDGLVDPTIGRAVEHLGYDRDFHDVERDNPEGVAPLGPVAGWWRVRLDVESRQVVVPSGVLLDLGATAKALAADRAATAAAQAAGCGVLVALGGDISVAGPPPSGGWRVTVGDDHADTDPDRDPVVAITAGGLATSSTARRTWTRGGRQVHHIVDPRTGDTPEALWRTVSVTAASCVDANTASTAAIVLGRSAPAWLADRGLPARLVAVDGTVRTVAGWPDDPRMAADR
jgi:thiamine biosynthesis lipoprotein